MALPSDKTVAAWVFLGTWLALIPAVAGDVTWFDSGEFLAGSAGLGVTHPTGFPLLSLIGFVASYLPLGSMPFRMATISALAVAASTALCFLSARRLGIHTWIAAMTSVLYPAVYVVWLHATILEAYALNVMLIACLFYIAVAPRPQLRTAMIITGLGLGSHATFVLMALLIWLYLLYRHRPWKHLPELTLWGLLGASVILYLPAAASREPWLLWTDTSTWSGLIEHLTGAGIREAFQDEMGGSASTFEDIQRWAANAAGPFGTWLLGVLVLALTTLHRAPGARLALGLLVVDMLFSVLLNPMGQADLQTGMPGAWFMALSMGIIVQGLVGERSARRPFALLGLLCTLFMVGSDRFEERQEETLAGVWGRSLLLSQAPSSLMLTSSDHLSGQSIYLQSVEGLRPDICGLVIQHLPKSAMVDRQYRRVGWRQPESFVSLAPQHQMERQDALVREALAHRPVYWELGDGRFDARVSESLKPSQGLHRVAWDAEHAAQKLGPVRSPIQHSLERLGKPERLSTRTRRVLSDTARLRGVWHLIRGEVDAGAFCLEEALALDPAAHVSRLNLAAARARQGRVDDAIALLYEVTAQRPSYVKAWRNLVDYLERSGRSGEADVIRRERDLEP